MPGVYSHVWRWGLGVEGVPTPSEGGSVWVGVEVHEVLLKVRIDVIVSVEAPVMLVMRRPAARRVPVLPWFSPWGRWRSTARRFTVC